MYKHIFLDFDDTVYDTRRNADEALEELYQHFRLGAYFDDFRTFSESYWKKNHEVWALYSQGKIQRRQLIIERFLYPLQQAGTGDEKMALELNEWFLERTSQKSALIEGALDLLEYLHGKYKLHILSNGFTEVQFKKLKSAGVEHYFDQVILSEQAGVNKPDPRIFDFALEKTGARREEVIMIGDNYDTDITGAIRSRIDQLFFNQNERFRPDVPPTYEVKRLAEIQCIL
ncbi:MAG: YjjG family noncanonical pyrimidine nucleotidase [Bacteroidales bacterium]